MMSDRKTSTSPTEISSLKETLIVQQEIRQKLHNELEAEREATNTAASEALSVIHRLQEEKAAVTKEAEQYKRFAEEKMCHAEESFAVIKDVIFHREMEMAHLEYQLQCYRYKLLSLGCIDPGNNELAFPEHLLQLNGNEWRTKSLMMRRNSEPVLGKCNPKSPDSGSNTEDEKTVQDTYDPVLDSDKEGGSAHDGISSYKEQVKELNERVKAILETNNIDVEIETRSDRSCSPGALDIFEAPQVNKESSGEKLTSCKCTEIYKPRGKDEETNGLKKHSCKTGHVCGNDCVKVWPRSFGDESASSTSHQGGTMAGSSDREEGQKLLEEIEDKLNLLQEQIRKQKVMELSSPRSDDPPSLPEAMLNFML